MKTTTSITLFDAEGQSFQVKVTRPRILDMAAKGKIPNPLMGIATKLMGGKQPEPGNITEHAQMMELYCRASMVEPTYDELPLDDDQVLTIFGWATIDVRQLSSFRGEQKHGAADLDGQGLSDKAEPVAGAE
jgi:hypothetical protein